MVSVKNRAYGARNRRSQFHDPVGIDDVLRSREVAPPLRLLMCCPTSSDAAAAVITSGAESGCGPGFFSPKWSKLPLLMRARPSVGRA